MEFQYNKEDANATYNNQHKILSKIVQNMVDILEDGVIHQKEIRQIALIETEKYRGDYSHTSEALDNTDGTGSYGEEPSSIKHIEREILMCRDCNLSLQRRQAVAGIGVENPDVLIVGEAPGEQEDIKGMPFVGKSGEYLDKWLEAIGLSRNKNVFITNTVKCRPPNNRNPLPNELRSCNKYLKQQINILQPKLILALGKIAGNILTNNEEKSLRVLRSQIHSYCNIPLYITYHPSAVLRNPSELRALVWEDLQKVQRALENTS